MMTMSRLSESACDPEHMKLTETEMGEPVKHKFLHNK